MSQRLLPEAIRGSWFVVPDKDAPEKTGNKPMQSIRFRLDGSFSRFAYENNVTSESETGDYTFDGNFLIVRGRATETYRVKPASFWLWQLEGTKAPFFYIRGLVTENDFVELSAADQKEIRLLPIRVVVSARHDHPEGIFDLTYEHDGKSIPVGSFFAEPDGDKLWVGISRFTDGIDLRTWERIIRESYLDIFRSKPDVGVVTVRLIDQEESRVFNYANG